MRRLWFLILYFARASIHEKDFIVKFNICNLIYKIINGNIGLGIRNMFFEHCLRDVLFS